jgi:hypothetical protein
MSCFELRVELSAALSDEQEEAVSDRFDAVLSRHASVSFVSGAFEGETPLRALAELEEAVAHFGLSIAQFEQTDPSGADAAFDFAMMLLDVPDVEVLARTSGLDREVIERKRHGRQPVAQWDVWALRYALEHGEASGTKS